MRSRYAERALALEPISMKSAVPSVKWKTTASAACMPRRASTSPYSMAATVLPTASRIVCSLFSGLVGPIILGCSPLLACWLSIRAPSALADDLYLYLPTPRILRLHGPALPGLKAVKRRQACYKLDLHGIVPET